jgi:hypothetical protein
VDRQTLSSTLKSLIMQYQVDLEAGAVKFDKPKEEKAGKTAGKDE